MPLSERCSPLFRPRKTYDGSWRLDAFLERIACERRPFLVVFTVIVPIGFYVAYDIAVLSETVTGKGCSQSGSKIADHVRRKVHAGQVHAPLKLTFQGFGKVYAAKIEQKAT